jgi:hypothetical protein
MIRNDFEIDSDHANEIVLNKLFDGLFGLVNSWVPTIEKTDYA